jgi:patatin-like phospholipase/acyl hydrolase
LTDQKTFVVLFNYGGGMRGLIPAILMSKIEDATGLRMSEMVDVFAGPSTGAILNAALNVPKDDDPTVPKYKARHMVKFYKREGRKIFPEDRFRDFRGFIHDFNNRTMKIGQLNALFKHGHYDPAYLTKCLSDLYGETRFDQSLKNLVVPVYNIDGEQLRLARERDEDESAPVHTKNNFVDGGGHALWLKNMHAGVQRPQCNDVRMQDAILGTTAAPTYFPCHHFKADGHDYSGIDGSIFDNPCISYHGAIRHHIPKDANVIMILLGTGHNLRSIKKDDWNSYGGLGVVDPVNDLPLISILFHAPESALVESFSEELSENLFVFNKSMLTGNDGTNTPSEAIDDASPENLERMEIFAENMVKDHEVRFETLCRLLININERRNSTSDPSFWSKLFKRF